MRDYSYSHFLFFLANRKAFALLKDKVFRFNTQTPHHPDKNHALCSKSAQKMQARLDAAIFFIIHVACAQCPVPSAQCPVHCKDCFLMRNFILNFECLNANQIFACVVKHIAMHKIFISWALFCCTTITIEMYEP